MSNYKKEQAGGSFFSSDSQEHHGDQQGNDEITIGKKERGIPSIYKSSQVVDYKGRVCSYEDVLNYLNLIKDDKKSIMSRPVKDHKITTTIHLQMLIYAILDVREADHTFISYIWVYMQWKNDYTEWNPEEFCGIPYIVIPAEALWKPDLMIEEMTEKDKAPPSPYICINADGTVELRNDLVVVSTCEIHIYKFPFDLQKCNISFKSVMYSDDELNIAELETKAMSGEWSSEAMGSRYEWMFINQTITSKTVNYFGFNQSVIVYTITMKRKSALYVANFLLPILFFLCLDFASFLMSDGGDKVGFKVTVLLAVTVMQLILNEILPATSNKIPLIVIYCIGIFGLMLFSLLETIFVKYLKEKDSGSWHRNTDNDQRIYEDKEIHEVEIHEVIDDEMTDLTSSIYREEGSSQLTELLLAVEKISRELGVIKKTVLRSSNVEQEKPGCWTRVANRLNKVFMVFYISAVAAFLCTLFTLWVSESD
ncbi:5-hydroxytryptamine receptor 3A-like [Kryptolebias marmoratus]|uniref:5-hydroxytryptamine receptor 3A-like n=1 Tax=Kryptolebias marmoratus TaxID=37003 RepID=UPI000D530F65|nr:5-hydroxytryptamine receptor 3A-like [Kryptolebias marmoratus]